MHRPLTIAEIRERQRVFTFRHPVVMALLTQVSFWIVANTLFVLLMVMFLTAISFHVPGLHVVPLRIALPGAVLLGIAYGTILGCIDLLIERSRDPDRAWGLRILLKAILYTGTFVVLVSIFFNLAKPIYERYVGGVPPPISQRWMLLALLLFATVGNLLVSFFKEVDRSFGPGLMRPLMMGRYRKPQVEQRIFMFMDLKGSTTHAETLGHIRYSAMVRDLFQDVNRMVPRFEAEIYQYVGDEVVLTWDLHDGPEARRCLLLFYAVQDAITERASIYEHRYGTIPFFKAGVHAGTVTAVEIGDIKREIAYHGDTVNTAARIQSMSNEFGRTLLISEAMKELCGDLHIGGLGSEALGSILLKGKSQHVTIHAVEPISS
ncbi:MAG: adenylate/guanylate cyclase domain-containing protein [Flavobacteriales bacterium]|nr:adenylate/guanylate cyclase domain-containing protein [Flavobacteriales bacterium]